MIQKRLDEITKDDLSALIFNGVAESRTIEYKRELPGGTDLDKKEFLADVSSFANTSGGDLIYGVAEDQGCPSQISGLVSADVDLEIRRLESILASGLDPRITYAVKVVPCESGLKAIVIRIERSWSGPHRVIFQRHDKFYGRNAKGKYPLDVNELRAAFTFSSALSERIRSFRVDRLIALSNNQTPVPCTEGPKLVLHCGPVASFSGQPQFDILPFYGEPTRLMAIKPCDDWDRRLNLDGLLLFRPNRPSGAYTQLYRNGIIEMVDGFVLGPGFGSKPSIPSIVYEKKLLEWLTGCFFFLEEIGANAPVVVAVSITNSKGLEMGVDSGPSFARAYPLEVDTLPLPEVVVEHLSSPVEDILRPIFNLVWNACGFPSSLNFDRDGKFKHQYNAVRR